MDFKIGRQIAGEIPAKTSRPAVAAVDDEIDIGVQVEQIQLGCQIKIILRPQIFIYPLPNGEQRRRQGDVLDIT